MESEVTLSILISARKLTPIRSAAFAWIMLALFCALSPAPSRASLIWVSNLGTDVTSSFSSNGLLSESLSVSSVPWSLPFEGAPWSLWFSNYFHRRVHLPGRLGTRPSAV